MHDSSIRPAGALESRGGTARGPDGRRPTRPAPPRPRLNTRNRSPVWLCDAGAAPVRSEEHTSELPSQPDALTISRLSPHSAFADMHEYAGGCMIRQSARPEPWNRGAAPPAARTADAPPDRPRPARG